jgi:hypothetical protein
MLEEAGLWREKRTEWRWGLVVAEVWRKAGIGTIVSGEAGDEATNNR